MLIREETNELCNQSFFFQPPFSLTLTFESEETQHQKEKEEKEEKEKKRKRKKKKRGGDDSNSTIIYYWSYPAWYQRRLRPIRRTAIFSVTNIIEYRDIVGECEEMVSKQKRETSENRFIAIN